MQTHPLLLAQLAVSGALAGLCWTVQLAVYPQFARVRRAAGAEVFQAFHAAHTRALGALAGPLMVAELILSLAVAWRVGRTFWTGAGLGLTLATWAWTFAVMVPRHERLRLAAGAEEAGRLAGWNWPRTVLWTARVGVAALAAAAG